MGWYKNQKTSPSAASTSLPPGPHRWAIVDVETSGLYPSSHRVLSVAALAFDNEGRPDGQFVSLVNGECDPGPVHIHGLTQRRLAGAPLMSEVIPELHALLEGRVLVAHNASFDYGFLAAEARRARTILPVSQRLCTLALSRRLGVNVPNHRLETLAKHWGVPQQRAHDAHDDARVLTGIFAHNLTLAAQLGLSLPLVDCSSPTAGPKAKFPVHVAKIPCIWINPGPLRRGQPLVQGMRIALTGETSTDRPVLVARLSEAGLDVMTTVSRLTSVLVTNDGASGSAKATRARLEGTLVIDESALLALLADVRPGQPRTPAAAKVSIPSPDPVPVPVPAPRAAPGPLADRRVLVIGGTHQEATAVRTEFLAQGGTASVNLSASVTDIVVLGGGSNDRRLVRAESAGVRIHHGGQALDLILGGAQSDGAATPADPGSDLDPDLDPGPGATVLVRGGVIDLPAGDLWTVNVAWRADALTDGTELDLVGFLVDDDHQVGSDEDFVFFNAPVSETAALTLSVDGDSEQSLGIDLSLLADARRVVAAAVLTGTSTFADLGAVSISIDDAQQVPLAASTLDAGTVETAMILAEVYRRGDVWRVRAVGQGYAEGLAALATRYGVSADS